MESPSCVKSGYEGVALYSGGAKCQGSQITILEADLGGSATIQPCGDIAVLS